MELSIFTNYFADLSLEEAIERISACGVRLCELCSPNPFGDCGSGELMRKTRRLRRHCESVGVRPLQAHGYWGEFIECRSREWKSRIAVFKEEIRIAAEIGVKTIVVHPMHASKITEAMHGKRPSEIRAGILNASIDFFSELMPQLDKCGVSLSLENMPSSREGFTRADEILAVANKFPPRLMGVCLDTGHLHQTSGSQSEFIIKAGSRLIATHISDCLELQGNDLHIFPLFSAYGKWIDWHEVREALSETGYNGTFNLEVPGEGSAANRQLDLREDKLRFMAETLGKFLSEPPFHAQVQSS